MKVFELHFNPKTKEDRVFDSFIYEPENPYEKRLGNLYVVGELTKVLPQNTNFLNNLASLIKKEYYGSPFKKTYETSFRDALKKANEFLDKEVREGNVSWLGNLSFAALSFRDFILNFTKVGNIKILLIRGEECLDISQNLEFQDIEPYPLKVFGSIASGKLSQNDKIIISTKEAFSVFSKNEKALDQIKKTTDEKGIKDFLKMNKQILSEISGICLLLIVQEEFRPKETLVFRKEKPSFSFRKIFSAALHKIPRIKTPKIAFPVLKPPHFPNILKSFHFPNFPNLLKTPHFLKSVGLILALILILVASSVFFGNEKEKELSEARQKITEAQSKITMAENFLILKNEEKATAFFQEALDIILPLTERGCPLRDEAILLQKLIEENLKK